MSGTQKEDTQHSSGDLGQLLLTVRQDSAAALGGTDGDYQAAITDANGRLHVNATISSGGGTEYTTDVAAPAAPVGGVSLAIRDDALGGVTPVEGDWVPEYCDANGARWVSVSNTVTVASHAVTNAGTFAVQIDGSALTALQLLDDTVVTLGTDTYSEASTSGMVVGAVRNDTLATLADTDNELAPLQVNASGALYIQEGSALDVSAATVTVDGSGVTQPISHAALTELAAAIDTEVQCDIVGSLPAGTNAIGKLAANSGVDIGDVDVTSQPARAATTDNVGAALMTNVIHDGTTALTPKFAVIDAATSGDNTLVAAVVGKKLRVLAAFIVAAGSVNARFEDGAAGTALTGQMNLTTNSGFVLPFNPVGWFETSANTLLNLELSDAISADGSLVYVEV